MAQKKSYSRYFIILQEDEKGYSLASDKIASGYAKLETKNGKCKISYYVQNLKKDKTPYYMVLICNKKDTKKIINIGEMNIDDYGRADIGYEYPIDNICNSGIPIDRVSGAAIVRILDNNIISVMSGFSSMEIPKWKSFAIVKDKHSEDNEEKVKSKEPVKVNKKKERSTKVEDKVESKTESKSIFDKYEEKIELEKSNNVDSVKIDKDTKPELDVEQFTNKISDLVKEEHKEKLNKIKDEKSNDVKKCNVENENIISDEKVKDSGNEEIYIDDSSTRDLKEDISDYVNESKNSFFKSLVDEFEEVPAVSNELKRCKWYKVPVTYVESMNRIKDYNKYTFICYPMLSYYDYIKNHSHFLMGYKYDKSGNVKYMIYGIPGTKSKSEQPYEGRTGFVTWVSNGRKDKLGYWLMFYDFRTGTVDIPVENNNVNV